MVIWDSFEVTTARKYETKKENSNEIVFGSKNDDLIIGNKGNNPDKDEFYGFDGDDIIDNSAGGTSFSQGGKGNDTIIGSSLNDGLWGNEDTDTLSGGSGDDTLVGGSGNDILTGGSGDDKLEGGEGADVFKIDSGYDTIVDLEFNDVFEISNEAIARSDGLENYVASTATKNEGSYMVLTTANSGGTINVKNSKVGQTSIFYLEGKDGDDTLVGSVGNDHLMGGSGDDTLTGEAGWIFSILVLEWVMISLPILMKMRVM